MTARTLPLWRDALADAGPGGVRGDARRPPAGTGRRLLGVLVAAREPLERLPAPPDATVARARAVLPPRRRRDRQPALADRARARTWPRSARTRRSRRTCAARRRGRRSSAATSTRPRRELPDGDVLTFAHDSAGRLRPDRGERWDRAERALVHDLREHGWVDAFRALHGYESRHASWTFAAGPRRVAPRPRARPRASARSPCEYAHEWRRSGLSDHSALVVDLEPQPNAAGKPDEAAQRRVVARQAQGHPRLVEVPLALEAERCAPARTRSAGSSRDDPRARRGPRSTRLPPRAPRASARTRCRGPDARGGRRSGPGTALPRRRGGPRTARRGRQPRRRRPPRARSAPRPTPAAPRRCRPRAVPSKAASCSARIAGWSSSVAGGPPPQRPAAPRRTRVIMSVPSSSRRIEMRSSLPCMSASSARVIGYG